MKKITKYSKTLGVIVEIPENINLCVINNKIYVYSPEPCPADGRLSCWVTRNGKITGKRSIRKLPNEIQEFLS